MNRCIPPHYVQTALYFFFLQTGSKVIKHWIWELGHISLFLVQENDVGVRSEGRGTQAARGLWHAKPHHRPLPPAHPHSRVCFSHSSAPHSASVSQTEHTRNVNITWSPSSPVSTWWPHKQTIQSKHNKNSKCYCISYWTPTGENGSLNAPGTIFKTLPPSLPLVSLRQTATILPSWLLSSSPLFPIP